LVLVEFREESGLGTDQRFFGFGGDRFVGLNTAIAANVNHDVAALSEDAAHEQTAMTVSGIFLATEQCNAEALDASLKARDGFQEMGVVAEPTVNDSAGSIVIRGIRRAATQFRAKEQVSNSGVLQRALNEVFVKLGDIFRIRGTAGVHHNLNVMLADKREPRINGVVGVAEGEKSTHPHVLCKENSTL
jgi:hypothetical protein